MRPALRPAYLGALLVIVAGASFMLAHHPGPIGGRGNTPYWAKMHQILWIGAWCYLIAGGLLLLAGVVRSRVQT